MQATSKARTTDRLTARWTPFDSPEYSFEFKWNGIRALAAVDMAGWRLWCRQQADYTARYPELGVLRVLPAGTLVDGELVACDADGRPDLARLLRRHGLTDCRSRSQTGPFSRFRTCQFGVAG